MAPKIAANDLRMKVKRERALLSSLRGLFTAIARDYRTGLLRGSVPDVHARAGDALERVLLAHYRAVGEDFLGFISGQLSTDVRSTDEESAEIAVEAERAFARRAVQQAAAISRTTQKQADEGKAQAARLLRRPDGTGATDEEVIALAVTRMASSLARRAAVIATYETQWAAEASKVIEVTVLLQATGIVEVKGFQELGAATKTWRSQGDSRVRTGDFNHLAADGQRVPADQPFTVSGESLMWPGDTSMGASIGNVIRCRCSAEYDVGTIEDLRRAIGREIIEDLTAFDFPRTESTIVVGLDPEFDLEEP